MKRRSLLDAAVAAMAAAALPAAAQGSAPQADLRRLQAHLRFLADPLLEGRETGTRGYDLAAAYVASQFAQLGLKPMGDGGGFAQAVPLRTSRLAATEPVLELCRGDACERLAWLDEFSTRADLSTARSDVKAPLAFAGYGITAPKFGWRTWPQIVRWSMLKASLRFEMQQPRPWVIAITPSTFGKSFNRPRFSTSRAT